MARTKPIRRSYGAGEWGRNRVRVFPDPKTGLFQIEWRDNGRRLTRSLKHRDWRRAKRQADEFAAGYLGPEMHGKAEAESEPLTLETLFDIYGEEVTPTKVERVRHRDRTATRMFLDFLGRDRIPETLSQRDWDRFIRERRSGRVGPSGKPVANRMIERDLKFLLAVLNWAVEVEGRAGSSSSSSSNPLRGPEDAHGEEPDPGAAHRAEEYEALLEVSLEMDWRFHVWLWSSRTRRDTASVPSGSFDGRTLTLKVAVIRWRGEHEKTRLRTPDPGECRSARCPGRGTEEEPRDRVRAPAARALKDPIEVCEPFAGRSDWWEKAQELAGLEAEAWPRLALPETEVRLRPHGPAAQGALRTRRLEGGQDGAPVLPAGRRGTAQEGSGEPTQRFAPEANQRESIGGNPVRDTRKFNYPNQIRICLASAASPSFPANPVSGTPSTNTTGVGCATVNTSEVAGVNPSPIKSRV